MEEPAESKPKQEDVDAAPAKPESSAPVSVSDVSDGSDLASLRVRAESEGDVKTLWVGDLPYWVDESYLERAFTWSGEMLGGKVIRNKTTGRSEGYGFVEFATHAAAERALRSYNGHLMPGLEQAWRLNWASFGASTGPEFSIFVGDLAPDVNDFVLQETFRTVYVSVRSAKVVTDLLTGRSKGYGFVRFSDETDRDRALTEMHGQYCSTRPMRVSLATAKKPQPAQAALALAAPLPLPSLPGMPSTSAHGDMFATDSTNTTVFVGGLDANVGEDELRSHFAPYGELVYVKIPAGKGCGFVQFVRRADAEAAIIGLHNVQVGSQAVRLSWGRSPSSKLSHAAAQLAHAAMPPPHAFPHPPAPPPPNSHVLASYDQAAYVPAGHHIYSAYGTGSAVPVAYYSAVPQVTGYYTYYDARASGYAASGNATYSVPAYADYTTGYGVSSHQSPPGAAVAYYPAERTPPRGPRDALAVDVDALSGAFVNLHTSPAPPPPRQQWVSTVPPNPPLPPLPVPAHG